jgi:predicted outer membrane protein
LDSLLVGSLKIQLATSGIKTTDLQTSAIAPDTRSQDLKKLEDSFDVANKEQSQWHEQVLNLLETYGQLLHATKSTQDAKIK